MKGVLLIVEDTPQVAANLEIALEGLAEFRIVIAGSGAEALLVLEDGGQVAAMITDLEMPRMGGLELIGRVRADPRFAYLPVIAASGSADEEAAGKALAAGADAFFPKPYSPAELRVRLEQLLHEKKNS
jgi:CheY-like chemotaxis protein